MYDYWFTQFDFPDENGKPYRSSGGAMVWNEQVKHEIPEKWSICPIVGIAGIYQPQTISNDLFDNSLPYCVYGGGGLIGRYSDFNHLNTEIIISCRGSCGNIFLTMPKSWITGNAMVIQPDSKIVTQIYLYEFLKTYGVEKYISGSVQKQLTRENLSVMPIIIPSMKILFEFDKLAKPIVEIMQNKIMEIDKLIRLRNWLLPMLMNGQATIAD